MPESNLVTLFPPNAESINYQNIADVKITGSVITFYVQKDSTMLTARRITSSVPFTYFEVGATLE
jgi:hypothetical protein